LKIIGTNHLIVKKIGKENEFFKQVSKVVFYITRIFHFNHISLNSTIFSQKKKHAIGSNLDSK
jgi:hypothetical protein